MKQAQKEVTYATGNWAIKAGLLIYVGIQTMPSWPQMPDMKPPCLLFALLGFPHSSPILPLGMFTLSLYTANISHVVVVVMVVIGGLVAVVAVWVREDFALWLLSHVRTVWTWEDLRVELTAFCVMKWIWVFTAHTVKYCGLKWNIWISIWKRVHLWQLVLIINLPGVRIT